MNKKTVKGKPSKHVNSPGRNEQEAQKSLLEVIKRERKNK